MTTLYDVARRWGRLAHEHPADAARLWAGLARRIRARCGTAAPRVYRRLRARLWHAFSDAAPGGNPR